MDPCSNPEKHPHHLCKLTADGLHLKKPKEYIGLVKKPQYVCKSCGRIAAEKNYLCQPIPFGTWED